MGLMGQCTAISDKKDNAGTVLLVQSRFHFGNMVWGAYMMESKSKKDYADEIRFAEDELLILQKKDKEIIMEIEEKEGILEKMGNRCCVRALIGLLLTMPLLWYVMVKILEQDGMAWLLNINLIALFLTAVGIWIYTAWSVRRLGEQKKMGTYWRKNFLFAHPTLAAEIEELQNQRRDIRARMELNRIRKYQAEQNMNAIRGDRWFLYDESINSRFTDEEKEELINVMEENNTYHLLSQTESRLFEVCADIRHIRQKREGIRNKGKRIKVLLSAELVVMVADIIPLALLSVPYDKTEILAVAGAIVAAIYKMPFLFILEIMLLIFIPTFIKYIAYGNNPVAGFFRHVFGVKSVADVLSELEEEQRELEKEEEKCRYKKAVLEG